MAAKGSGTLSVCLMVPRTEINTKSRSSTRRNIALQFAMEDEYANKKELQILSLYPSPKRTPSVTWQGEYGRREGFLPWSGYFANHPRDRPSSRER